MPEKFALLGEKFSSQEITLQAIKGVYGLGDAPRLWRERFHEWMIKNGFNQSKYDECFYSKKIRRPPLGVNAVDALLLCCSAQLLSCSASQL